MSTGYMARGSGQPVPLVPSGAAGAADARGKKAGNLIRLSPWARTVGLDFLFLVDEGDSYGSRRGGFCFIADCPVREDSR